MPVEVLIAVLIALPIVLFPAAYIGFKGSRKFFSENKSQKSTRVNGKI